jgi:LysR family hca operon transcriptional activator
MPRFVIGFLVGTEMEWFPEAVRLLRDELPNIEVTLASQNSPDLTAGLMRGKLDLAFLRPEPGMPDLAYRHLVTEPLVAVLSGGHRLAAREAVAPRDLAGETFIGIGDQAPTLRAITDDYIAKSGLALAATHEATGLSNAISLVASTGGVALLPRFAQNFLPRSVVSRKLAGGAPTIDLVLGYHRANSSPLLKLFLSRTDDLVARVAARSGRDR